MPSPHDISVVQARVLDAFPACAWQKPKDLLLALKKILRDGHGSNLLNAPDEVVNKHVLLDPKAHRDDPDPPAAGPHVILGGEKSSRDPAHAYLKRDDGAWIHFKITVTWDGASKVALDSYDFELVFPKGHTPPWLRIDLNPPDHDNESAGLRSHIHPGNDDLMVPSPVMTPEEILHLFVHGLRPRNPGKPRR